MNLCTTRGNVELELPGRFAHTPIDSDHDTVADYLTVIESTDGTTAGKVLDDAEAGPVAAGVHRSRWNARTVHVPDLEAMEALLRSLKPSQALVTGYVPGTEDGEPFLLLSTTAGAETLGWKANGKKKPPTVLGWYKQPRAKRWCCRVAENFNYSSWRLFDLDAKGGFPEELACYGVEAFRELLAKVHPPAANAEMIGVPSTKNRIIETDTGTVPWRSGSMHVWVHVTTAPRLWVGALKARCIERGLFWWKPIYCRQPGDRFGEVITKVPEPFYDPAPMKRSCGVAFDGPPVVNVEGYAMAEPEITALPGEPWDTRSLEMPPKEVRERIRRETGIRVDRDGTTVIEELSLDWVLDTEVGVMTLEALVEKYPGEKIRCQADWRGSTSDNGFVQYHKNGTPFVYDNGSMTKYTLPTEEESVVLSNVERDMVDRIEPAERIPCPLAAIPETLRNCYFEIARWAKVDPALVAGHGIAVLAAATMKQARVTELEGLAHYLTQFVVTLLPSGERKSPVHKKLVAPLRERRMELAEEYQCELGQWQQRKQGRLNDIKGLHAEKNRVKTTDERKKAIPKEIAKIREAQTADLPPTQPLLYVDDVTAEAFITRLQQTGGAVSVLSPEGRGFIETMLGHYSKGQSKESVFLQAYSGDDIHYDRKGGGEGQGASITIYGPCSSIGVMVQEDVLAKLTQHISAGQSGLNARMTFIRPEAKAGTRFESDEDRPISEETADAYRKLVRNLTSYKVETAEPIEITLDEDVVHLRRTLANEIETRQQFGNDLADHRDMASKYVSKVVKLAALFTLIKACESTPLHRIGEGAEKGTTLEVDAETFDDAQQVATWMLLETLAARIESDEEEGVPMQLLAWAQRHGEPFTLRDVQNLGPNCLRKRGEKGKEAREDAARWLVTEGALKASKGRTIKYQLA